MSERAETPASPRPEPPLLEVPDRAALRAWLEANHATSRGVRIALTHKGSQASGLGYEDAVEEALAFGWIDARANRLDAERYTGLFTPRRPKSVWSRSNKARIERLTAAGLMTPAGFAAVEAAKQNGSWTSLDDVEALVIPDDLARSLAEAGAGDRWEAAPPGQRKLALYSIFSAKRTETRSRRIAAIVTALEAGRPLV